MSSVNNADFLLPDKNFTSLKKWNILLAFLHFVQFIGAITFAALNTNAVNFRVPLLTHYAEWLEDTGPKDATQKIATIPLAFVTCALPLMTSFSHLFVVKNFNQYQENLGNFFNTWRWIEYSVTSTLMFFLIALLFSIYDLSTLLCLCVMNATVMYCGYLMEQHNKDFLKGTNAVVSLKWHSFWVGSAIGIVQWALLYSTFSQGDSSNMPAFVWAAIMTYFFLYFVFALNMGNFYRKVANSGQEKFKMYYTQTENNYMWLSLISKSILLWIIIFGVNQPSSYTDG